MRIRWSGSPPARLPEGPPARLRWLLRISFTRMCYLNPFGLLYPDIFPSSSIQEGDDPVIATEQDSAGLKAGSCGCSHRSGSSFRILIRLLQERLPAPWTSIRLPERLQASGCVVRLAIRTVKSKWRSAETTIATFAARKNTWYSSVPCRFGTDWIA